jgi:hypothetical protein
MIYYSRRRAREPLHHLCGSNGRTITFFFFLQMLVNYSYSSYYCRLIKKDKIVASYIIDIDYSEIL